MIALIIILGILFVLFLFMNGAPFLATHKKILKKITDFAEIKSGEKTLDLGSGDGRIVIALANVGAQAHGFEINPILVWWSKRKIKKAGLKDKAFIYCRDFWTENFSSFDVITVFGIPHIMSELEKKLKRELRPGARVISAIFSFPNWQFLRKENGVYLYKV